ncbi:MAG: response regulator [Pyrinomonadaceae bacterium]
MRLELEQNDTHPGYDSALDAAVEDRAAQAANYLREGIRAAQSGNRAAARIALLGAAELDPQSESAWLWLSSISEYPEELLAFLTNVLEINPHNARALEWTAATKALLAKNLIQRGIDAAESNQNELATQLFNQALEHDEKNSMAWLWLASLCDSNEGKLSYLEKALEFDPENETARAGFEAARNSIREGLLAEARAAAVTGNSQAANELLDAVIAEEPDAEDAWVLKSHIAISFEEKIVAFRRVLEINPENGVARSGLDSLTAIMDAVAVRSPTESEIQSNSEPEAQTESFDEADTAEEADVVAAEFVDPPWADNASDDPVEASSEDRPGASPFDSFANEPKVDLNGTMLMTASDFDFDFGAVAAEVTEEAASDVENAFANEVEEPAAEALGHDEGIGPAADQPESNDEAEEITYELVSEAPEVEAEYEPGFDESVVDDSFSQSEEVGAANEDAAGPADDHSISAPAGNPFDSAEFRNEPDLYQTVVSVDLDAEVRAAVQGLSAKTSDEPSNDDALSVPFDAARYTGSIPMPGDGLGQTDPTLSSGVGGYETRVIRPTAEPASVNSVSPCPFCRTENDVQAIACNSCLAVLTLADLELILANHHADKAVLRRAVEEIERAKASRDLSEAELTTLGIGHLNLRNLQFGYNYLHEAAQKNPNNVVLSSQANALLIRLEEIKQQDAAHDAMAKGKTILVVDDSPTVRKLIAGKLEKCGHEVYCSGDGVEAIDQLSALVPDLILLDITMPRMDGYQVCKLIRGSEATRETPVVMISGKDGFFDKVRGRMAGASGYITKPFGPETLMKAVESYLNPSN